MFYLIEEKLNEKCCKNEKLNEKCLDGRTRGKVANKFNKLSLTLSLS